VSLAQRRAQALTSLVTEPTTEARRSAVTPKQQPSSPTMTGPDWSVFAGIADGDNPFDIGVALGGTGRWHRSDWPVGVRGDAYFAHHGGNIGTQFGGLDLSVNIFGIMGGAEYVFENAGDLKPYAFGGLGVFYSNFSVDDDNEFGDDDYDSSTDVGLGIGGGLRFTPKFGVEVRFMKIGDFNTIPILAVFHF
jgi:hypothetical protein